jgi:hypothetical protein
MVSLMVLGALFGAPLGMHFRVLVLVPAMLIAVALVTAIGVASDEGVRALAVTVIAVAASLQAGYIAGGVLRATVSGPHVGRVVSTSGFSKSAL